MRPEERALDLNHLPHDLSARDYDFDDADSASTGEIRRSRNGEDRERMYECRFCSLKFCKSQALGGHMNRHRHEREAETLDKARQLVYSSDQNLRPFVKYQHNPSNHPHHGHDHQVHPARRPPVISGAHLPHYHQHPLHQSCEYTLSTAILPPRFAGTDDDHLMASYGNGDCDRDHALTGSFPRFYTTTHPAANHTYQHGS